MAAEAKRACGYRKVGGLYMMGGRLGGPCCKMPIPLHICPTCNQGVKQTRGWQWIDPKPWLEGPCADQRVQLRDFIGGRACPAADPAGLGERVGLLWIGTQFYPTPEAFMAEADRLGLSRRITAVPRGFKLGETWVFLAHPKTMPTVPPTPGIFRIFLPTAIEKIVTQSQSEDEAAMTELRERGITPVVVPDDDKDHQGTVYDDDDEAGLPLQEGVPA